MSKFGKVGSTVCYKKVQDLMYISFFLTPTLQSYLYLQTTSRARVNGK